MLGSYNLPSSMIGPLISRFEITRIGALFRVYPEMRMIVVHCLFVRIFTRCCSAAMFRARMRVASRCVVAHTVLTVRGSALSLHLADLYLQLVYEATQTCDVVGLCGGRAGHRRRGLRAPRLADLVDWNHLHHSAKDAAASMFVSDCDVKMARICCGSRPIHSVRCSE